MCESSQCAPVFRHQQPGTGRFSVLVYNAGSADLFPGGDKFLDASLTTPASWSDQAGQLGSDTAAFAAAVADVQQVGLSFGGGCFFSNGVGNLTAANFQLYDFSVSP